MPAKTIHLTLQVFGKEDLAWKQMIQRVLQTTLAAEKDKGSAYGGNKSGNNEHDDRAIEKENRIELLFNFNFVDDVMGEGNDGSVVERFDDVMRWKVHSAARWCRTEEVRHEDHAVKEVRELRRCSTKKIN